MHDGNFVYFEDIVTVLQIASKHCDVVITDDEFAKVSYSLALQNNSAFKPYFNEFSIKINELGITKRLIDKYVFSKKTCQHQVVETRHKPILFNTFVPVAYLFCCLILVAFLMFCFEKNIYRRFN